MDARITCIDTEREFQALSSEWNDLLVRSGSDSIFLTWEWISTWWEVYGTRSHLYVLTARDEDDVLVGIAPLKRRPRRILGLGRIDVLEFIGCGGDVTPEQLDFIVAKGLESRVTPALVDHIEHDPTVRGCDLRPFAAASPNLAYVSHAMRSGPGHVQQSPDSVCPVLPLPASWDEFMTGRSKNYRKKMGEYQRRCARDLGAHVRTSESPAELERDMTALVALHKKRWDGRSRAFRTDAYIQFHRKLSRRLFDQGWVRMFALDSARGPVAMLYCFAYADRYSFYQAGRDPECSRHRVGLVLMHKAIEQAIAERARVFDFLRGEEDYKYMWAADQVTAVRLSLWKSWPAWAVGHLSAVMDGAQASLSSNAAVVLGLAGSWSGFPGPQ